MLGSGIVKGMMETARNFFGSFRGSERLVTIQYPEERLPQKDTARTVPFLVYDGDDPMTGLRCTACKICEKECPTQCIYIVKDTAKKPDYVGKLQFFPKIFDVDTSVCMGCGICAEVCPFDSIKMDNVFELSTTNRFQPLLLNKHQLAKPNSYFQKVHPTDAAETDKRRAEEVLKAQAKAKAEAEAKAAAAANPPGAAAKPAPAAKPTPAPPAPAAAASSAPKANLENPSAGKVSAGINQKPAEAASSPQTS